MKKIIFVISVMALFFMAGCQPEVEKGPVIGGEQDEHGCYIAAGYTWCESKQKCLREFEEECPLTKEQEYGPPAQEKAIDAAKVYVVEMDEYKADGGEVLSVVNSVQGACPGCWVLDVDYTFASKEDPAKLAKATVQITMENWEVINANYMSEKQSEVLTPKGCAFQGGRVVNTVGGGACEEDEVKIGDIKAFISPHICCLPKQ